MGVFCAGSGLTEREEPPTQFAHVSSSLHTRPLMLLFHVLWTEQTECTHHLCSPTAVQTPWKSLMQVTDKHIFSSIDGGRSMMVPTPTP